MAVTIKLINYFKSLYSGHKIIYVRFSDNEFIFRTLNKNEYRSILLVNRNRKDIEDALCNAACLYPEEYDFYTCGFAGLPEVAAERIETLSGFNDIHVALDNYHEAKEQNTLELQAMDLIKAFIPEYTYEEMKDWTWQRLMETTVRAENVAKLRHFDWHLEDQSEEYEQKASEVNMDNKAFIDELYKSGVDPMIYFKDELQELSNRKNPVVDFPLISSGKWHDEEVLNAIRKQRRIAGRRG